MAGNGEHQEMEHEPTTDEPQNGVQSASEDIEEGSLIKAGCDDEGKIFVGGLSWNTDTKGLREYFSKYGEVKDCCIKEDSNSKKSRGFGFVLFADPESVKRVLDQPTHTLDNRKIDPKRAKALKKEHKLFAGGFSPDLTNDQLRAHFSKFGEIELLERPTEKTSDKPRGFCFITYKSEEAISKACNERFHNLEGKRCEVKKAEPQRDRGRGRGQPGYGFGPNYYQGGWNPQSWPQGLSGGDNFNQSGYGYGGGYGYGPSGGGYGPGQPGGYGNYYPGYGGYGGYGFQGGSGYGPAANTNSTRGWEDLP